MSNIIEAKFKVQLNDTNVIEASSETSIFKAALEQGRTIGHSCLNGRCSSCRAKVLKGRTGVFKNEEGLSEQELSERYILTCVRYAQTDLVLEVDDIVPVKMEKVRTLPCKVDRFRLLNDDVIELTLRMPPNANFNFLPGQYVNLIKGNIRRSYSIANADIQGRLSFYIKNYIGGKFSDYLFNKVKVGDLLRLEGPLGTFFYRDNKVKHTIFLATGTGIAPVAAMLDKINLNKEVSENKEFHLFYGGRILNDIIEIPEFENIKLKFYPCLSRNTLPDVSCYNGYVQYALLKAGLDLSHAEVYACGSSHMIVEAKALLVQNGLREKYFYSDAFVSSN